MRNFLGVMFGALLVAAVAYGGWPTQPPYRQPTATAFGPKSPTKLTAASAGEIHTTLSGKGVCVRVSCQVDVAYLTSASSSPSTATADANQLPAKTVEKFCLSATNDYLSLYASAAGSCYVAEINQQ